MHQAKAADEMPEGGSDDPHCFPPHQLVTTASGVKRMDELCIGDMVATTMSSSLITYRAIDTFYHRQANMSSVPYLHIHLQHGDSFMISQRHLLPIVDCDHNRVVDIPVLRLFGHAFFS